MRQKIDYSKAEKQFDEALTKMQIEQLSQGKPLTSSRAEEYFGLNEQERPLSEDPVEKLIEEEFSDKQTTPESVESGANDREVETQIEAQIDTLEKASPRRSPPQKAILPDKPVITKEMVEKPPSELLVLRRHIFWMKQQGIKDRYEQLGTSLQEVLSLRKKERMTDEEKLRVQSLKRKAEELRQKIIEKQGKSNNETLVEQEIKRHRTKRHNVREKWLPL